MVDPGSPHTNHNQRQRLLTSFVAESPAAVALFDRDMRYLATSERWRRDYGLSDDPVGRTHYEIFPEISDEWRRIHQAALVGEVVRSDEDRFSRHDGRLQWLRWEVRPWFNDHAQIGGITIYSEEITAPKAAQQALAHNLARYRALLDTAVAAIISIDSNGIIDSVNPATTAMFGYAADELIGQNVKILMPDPYAGEHDGYIARYLRTGERKIIGLGREVIARRKDGSTFPMHLAVSEFEAGGQRCFAGVITDLSIRRAAQDALSSSEMRFRAVFNSATVGMVQLDRAGRYLRANQRYQDMLGYSEQELLSLTPFDITHPDDRERDRKEVARLMTGEMSGYNAEKRFLRKDGEVIWSEIAVSRITDPADERAATLAVVIDITDRKHAETALKESERRLVQAQRWKVSASSPAASPMTSTIC